MADRLDRHTSRHTWEEAQPKGYVQDLSMLDWNSLVMIRPLLAQDVNKYTKDTKWQEFRTELLGLSLEIKNVRLRDWLQYHNFDLPSRVQVTNYVNALKRGGHIK